MDLDTVRAITDPLERAAAADRLMWERPAQGSAARAVRREAVLEAVAGGRAEEEVAAALRVEVRDVVLLTREPVLPGWAVPRPRATAPPAAAVVDLREAQDLRGGRDLVPRG